MGTTEELAAPFDLGEPPVPVYPSGPEPFLLFSIRFWL